MKSYTTILVACLCAVFAASSCRTHQIFEVLAPATYTLPSSIDTMLIVCCDEPQVWTDTNTIADPAVRARIANSERRLPSIICSVLYAQMNSDGYIPVKFYNKVVPFEQLPYLANRLCRETNTNCILAQKNVNYTRSIEVINAGIAVFIGQTVVKGSSGFSFMTPDGNYMDFAPVEYNDTVFTEAYSVKAAAGKSPSSDESIFNFGMEVADQLASMLTPGWRQEHRWLFALPSYRFASIADLIEKSQYDEARELLYNVYDNGRRRNRLRAALDISLTYEMEGNIDMAAIWCSKAMDIINNDKEFENVVCREDNYVNNLFAILQKRKTEILLLDRQMKKE